MIRNFSDHAANERTFLAWVRTAIAVMAFGFLIERFDLFLQVAAPSLAGQKLSAFGQRFANLAGLAFIVLGTVMIIIGRYPTFRHRKKDRQRSRSCRGPSWISPWLFCSRCLAAACFYTCPTPSSLPYRIRSRPENSAVAGLDVFSLRLHGHRIVSHQLDL